jgi:hypothetical protein
MRRHLVSKLKKRVALAGTGGSNPSPTSGESRTNRPAARHGSAFCPAECRHLAANISFDRACSRSTRICWYAIVQNGEIAMPALAQFITWIVMGLVGSSLVGLIITRERRGVWPWRGTWAWASPELSSAACCSAYWAFSLASIRSRSRCGMSWPPPSDRSRKLPRSCRSKVADQTSQKAPRT